MFFSLSRCDDLRFSYRYNLGRLTLNTDAGWHRLESDGHVLIYKGYMDSEILDEQVQCIKDQQHHGNFCVFDHDLRDGSISMKTNLYRGFTIWHDQDHLTNLTPGKYNIWADSSIKLDQDLSLFEEKIDIIGPIDTTEISRDVLIDWVHERLSSRIKSFLENNHLPLHIFCSGGIDTMLVFSYIKSYTKKFKMIWGNYLEWDEFWCLNQNHITTNFWGYKQIHHWKKPCILSSGTPGDEFMLRSPTTANLWLKHHGTSVMQEIYHSKHSMHRDYFSLSKHTGIFKKQEQQSLDLSKKDFYHHLCNIVVNDCQHWHIGETLTFTPLRDLEIFKKFLQLSLTDGVTQIMDSSISLELISRNDSSLVDHLSDVKNVGESFANLVGLMSKYPSH